MSFKNFQYMLDFLYDAHKQFCKIKNKKIQYLFLLLETNEKIIKWNEREILEHIDFIIL